MLINLVVGDWSDDGHGKTEHVCVEVNCTKDELQQAYDEGVGKLGFSMRDEVQDYENHILSLEAYMALVSSGFNFEDEENGLETVITEEDRYIGRQDYAILWMWIAHVGRPYITHKVVKQDNQINIGGYGLFY